MESRITVIAKNENENHKRKYRLIALELGFADLERDEYNMLWDRLFEYEETGLIPCEIVALKADNKRLKEQNSVLSDISTLNSNEVARLQSDVVALRKGNKLYGDVIGIKDERIAVLETALGKLCCDIQFADCPADIERLKGFSCADHRMKTYMKQAEEDLKKNGKA